MAKTTYTVLEDDIDGSEADETVPFSLDNVDYEIDLSAENAAKLRDALAPFVGAARRPSARGRGGRGRGRGTRLRANVSGPQVDTAAVRAWAREEGLQVSDRGRIPAEIMERYNEAHA